MGGSTGKKGPSPQVIEVPTPVSAPYNEQENSEEIQRAHKREMERLRRRTRQINSRPTSQDGLTDAADTHKTTLG